MQNINHHIPQTLIFVIYIFLVVIYLIVSTFYIYFLIVWTVINMVSIIFLTINVYILCSVNIRYMYIKNFMLLEIVVYLVYLFVPVSFWIEFHWLHFNKKSNAQLLWANFLDNFAKYLSFSKFSFSEEYITYWMLLFHFLCIISIFFYIHSCSIIYDSSTRKPSPFQTWTSLEDNFVRVYICIKLALIVSYHFIIIHFVTVMQHLKILIQRIWNYRQLIVPLIHKKSYYELIHT